MARHNFLEHKIDSTGEIIPEVGDYVYCHNVPDWGDGFALGNVYEVVMCNFDDYTDGRLRLVLENGGRSGTFSIYPDGHGLSYKNWFHLIDKDFDVEAMFSQLNESMLLELDADTNVKAGPYDFLLHTGVDGVKFHVNGTYTTTGQKNYYTCQQKDSDSESLDLDDGLIRIFWDDVEYGETFSTDVHLLDLIKYFNTGTWVPDVIPNFYDYDQTSKLFEAQEVNPTKDYVIIFEPPVPEEQFFEVMEKLLVVKPDLHYSGYADDNSKRNPADKSHQHRIDTLFVRNTNKGGQISHGPKILFDLDKNGTYAGWQAYNGWDLIHTDLDTEAIFNQINEAED